MMTSTSLPADRTTPDRATLPSFAKTVAILSALMAFASISTDLYLPAMPTLGQSLGGSQGSVELTLSSFLIGFSLGQLFWGPIGDRYGRRAPILFGLVLFMIGSAGCALAGSVAQLIVWRIVQAAGACAGPVLARAMARDLYGRDRAAQLLSTLMLVMGIAPLLGPLIGGQVLLIGSWRLIFWLLVVLGIAIFAAVLRLPESLPRERRSTIGLGAVLGNYWLMAKSRTIMGYAIASGCYYGGIYAYLAGTPTAYISYYHVAPQAYGLLFGLGIIGQMLLNLLNTRFVVRMGSDYMLRQGATLVGVSGVWAGVAATTGIGGLWGLVLPLFFFLSANGLFVANAMAGALAVNPDRSGAISAFVGAIQFGSGIFGSALVGWFADGTPRPMGVVIAVLGTASFIVTLRTIRQRRGSGDIIEAASLPHQATPV
jgi:DHA1 family bicyclomycin/chloramphenicol resistance-like MFS transporter